MTTGIARNNRRQQRINAELESIIEEFGRAMRAAYKPYIASYVSSCQHEQQIPFTPHMEQSWGRYVEWCVKYGKEDHI